MNTSKFGTFTVTDVKSYCGNQFPLSMLETVGKMAASNLLIACEQKRNGIMPPQKMTLNLMLGDAEFTLHNVTENSLAAEWHRGSFTLTLV